MRLFFLILLGFICNSAYASSFKIIALGVNGGITDGNLSAYLLAPIDQQNFIALDAGTLVQGLEKAAVQKAFTPSVGAMLTQHIPAYLISHAHLDHVAGLVIAEPQLHQDQMLIARQETLGALEKNLFNWSIWGNFTDKGITPHLDWQHSQIAPLQTSIPIAKTSMKVTAFPLNHGNGYPSTAFLIQQKNNYVLYFGDTGADEIEHDNKMQLIWNQIAPLIKSHQLKAILLECSFTNAQPDSQLFGHLKPALYLNELHKLANTVNPSNPRSALKGLIIFVTHVKPELESLPLNSPADSVISELQRGNDLGVIFILPKQGRKYLI